MAVATTVGLVVVEDDVRVGDVTRLVAVGSTEAVNAGVWSSAVTGLVVIVVASAVGFGVLVGSWVATMAGMPVTVAGAGAGAVR